MRGKESIHLGLEFAGCFAVGAASLLAPAAAADAAAYCLAFSIAEFVWFWVTFMKLATCSF